MPKRNKEDYTENGKQIFISSQWDVEVPNQPVIESFMPHSPKLLKPVIVEHASAHILNRVDPIHKSPQSAHSPNHCKFQVDEVKEHN